MVRIDRLRWDPVNTDHILQHGVRTNEVQEVVDGEWILEPGYGGRFVLIGQTKAGRMLAVALDLEPGGTHYPVTARPASRKERARYAVAFEQGEL